MYNYPIAIEFSDENHAYGVCFPDLPGCFSAGDTLEEAIANAKEALAGHLELLAEDGKAPPVPSTIGDHRDAEGYRFHMWVYVSIDPARYEPAS